MGSSAKIFTEPLVEDPRFEPLVTSRSLLEGIFTVRRMDLLESSGEFDGDRETVTEGEEATARVSLVGLDLVLETGGLDSLAVVARARRERRGGILNQKTRTKN